MLNSKAFQKLYTTESTQLKPILDLYLNQVDHLPLENLNDEGKFFFQTIDYSQLNTQAKKRLNTCVPLLYSTYLEESMWNFDGLKNAECLILFPVKLSLKLSQMFAAIVFQDKIRKLIFKPQVEALCQVIGEDIRHFTLKKGQLYSQYIQNIQVDTQIMELSLIDGISALSQYALYSCKNSYSPEIRVIFEKLFPTLPVFEYKALDADKVWTCFKQLLIKEVDNTWIHSCL